MASGSNAPLVPDFLRFLFSAKTKFDCYFKVGNPSQRKPVRIGAVKLMLMAHSQVFRRELEESDLKEKGDVPVIDINPDTFKGMLKYVYGQDSTSDLSFNKADDMFYVAEKYDIKTLKDKLAVRLIELLTPDNICSLLNNPACYTHLELNSAITEILRFETDRVLASPQFLWINAESLMKILEQDGLVVPEIELWRAAIKWAKRRANSEDGQLVRQQLSGLTKHLRLCTLTPAEICGEVATAEVLTGDEMNAVCKSIGRKRKPEGLTEICDEIVPRKRLCRPHELTLTNMKNDIQLWADYSFTLETEEHAIELLPLVCMSGDCDSIAPEKRTHKVRCTTKIFKGVVYDDSDSSYSSSSSNEHPTTVTFSKNVNYGVEFEIPLFVDGRNVTLLPDTMYTVKMKLNGSHKRYYKWSLGSGSYGNDHLTLDITKYSDDYYDFPSAKLQYRVTTVE